MAKYKILAVFNILVFAIICALLIRALGQPLPEIKFNCTYALENIPHIVVSDRIYFANRLRNPFFIPIKEVKVGLERVDAGMKKTVQETQGLFIYKGMMDWGGEKVAIIYVLEAKKTKFLKLGDFVKGYKVLDITEDEVVLSKEAGLSLITLKIGGVNEDRL